MKITRAIKISALATMLGILGNSCLAGDLQNWTEELTCGKLHYKLTSVCQSADPKDDTALNECKSQTLDISSDSQSKRVKLPELSRKELAHLKKAQEDPNELFVVQWGCGTTGSANILVLRYSAGYGNHDGVEEMTAYDDAGKLIEESGWAKYSKAIDDGQSKFKPVHSILPR
jgi:hypothetical protein